MTIKATAAGVAIPMGVKGRLLDKKEGKHLCAQLKKVSEEASQIRKEGSVKLEFLFRNSDRDITFADAVRLLLRMRAELDSSKSPLLKYFARSPEARILTLGTCPAPGDDDFPTNTQGTRIYHFAAAHQHLLYNVAGSYYDEHLQWVATDKLSSTTCTAAILPLPHVQDDRHFLCIIDPEGQDVMLPKHGEICKIYFPGAIETPAIDVGSIAFEFFKILNDAQTEASFHQYVLEHAGKFFNRDLTVEEIEELLQTEEERDTGSPIMWSDRVSQWVDDHHDILRAPDIDGGNQDNARWFSAFRVDFPSPNLKTHYQTYLVWKPTDKDAETSEGQPKPVLPISLPNLEPPKQAESAVDFFTRLMSSENTQDVQIKRMSSDKTIRAEVNAVNSLKHPISADPPPSEKSVAAYKYLMRFDPTTAKTNLLDEIPALGNVINPDNGNAPQFLRNIFNRMNRPMRDAFSAMSSLPAGICFLPGVAGSGKSYMMEMAIIFSQFGSCEASVQPADAEPGKVKVLYLLNNNAGVEAFTLRLIETYKNLGIDKSPPVIRLYPMDNEVKSGMKGTTRQKYEAAFSQFKAEKDHKSTSLEDHFLATYALNQISLDIHNAYDRTRKAARQNMDCSLHRAALAYLKLNSDAPRYNDLVEQLGRIERGEEIDDDSKTHFKTGIKLLYQDFLKEFHGTVVTTPVAASNFCFRQAFRPDIIILDEAGTMRELTTLIPISFFSPKAWIVTGDVAQKPPFITMEHDLGSGKISSNPFSDQLTLSTLARASAAGAVQSSLVVNQRAFGNTMAHANTLAYYGTMQPGRMSGQDNWPSGLHEMIHHVRENINPSHPFNQCNMLVEFSGSQANKVANSLVNPVHLKWTLHQALTIYNSELKGLGKNESKLADILIVSFYKAQALEYQKSLKEMVDKCLVATDVYERIKIKTLDESQGDEADFVFADFVAVSHPGFTGEGFRITLATTRARGISIFLLNRGAFVGYEKPEVAERAFQLSRLYALCSDKGTVVRKTCCVKCEGDHTADQCTIILEHMANVSCERQSCGQTGHNAATCPDRVCRNCKARGHSANECLQQLLCSHCGNSGHVSFQCQTHNVADFFCQNCQERGHLVNNCPMPLRVDDSVQCNNCQGHGHRARDCTNEKIKRAYVCRLCGGEGHVKMECPMRQCWHCFDFGHSTKECTALFCSRCHKTGHSHDDCQDAPPKCGKCGGVHPTDRCEIFAARRGKAKKAVSIVRVNHNWKQAQRHLTPNEEAIANQLRAVKVLAGEDAGEYLGEENHIHESQELTIDSGKGYANDSDGWGGADDGDGESAHELKHANVTPGVRRHYGWQGEEKTGESSQEKW